MFECDILCEMGGDFLEVRVGFINFLESLEFEVDLVTRLDEGEDCGAEVFEVRELLFNVIEVADFDSEKVFVFIFRDESLVGENLFLDEHILIFRELDHILNEELLFGGA